MHANIRIDTFPQTFHENQTFNRRKTFMHATSTTCSEVDEVLREAGIGAGG